jgi:hypothetical protein
MMRIQSFSMGYAGFQKPIVQNPALRGVFDWQGSEQHASTGLSLAAGSPSGGAGADGGAAAPAPAPTPGAQQAIFVPTPNYLFPVATPVLPMPPEPVPAEPVVPTWAVVGGSLLAGLGIAALLFKKE